MGKKKLIHKRTGTAMAVFAIVLVIVVLILTIREGRELLNQDRPDTTEPVPYDSRESGENP
ncbi:hypothetical protein KK062_07000 [Fulvivirgaceae bacterium PWU5]|uniref:Uncharacterized protein n=1 Tax=Dawidia cretensis TaxID=2782350 RepID=A0AAP2DVE6_9BACT|nr:hypothetical protein [Dawidia cretensis]MBT1707961.1 hypothetical protein [Dawidia cretensis]